jgi:hypothetical protein
MPLINCEKCGNVFNSEKGQTCCTLCLIEENKELKRVTDYLKNHPLATVLEVNEKTKVSQSLIFKFINSGSLKIRKKPGMSKCRICGVDIKQGAVCESCREKINNASSSEE